MDQNTNIRSRFIAFSLARVRKQEGLCDRGTGMLLKAGI